MARPTVQDRIDAATAAFEAGFLSNAAKKRALEDLGRAYDEIRGEVMGEILKARGEVKYEEQGGLFIELATPEQKELSDLYYGVPSYLNQIRDRHLAVITRFSARSYLVRDLIALRQAIKDAEILPVPAKPESEARAETVRKSVIEIMEGRQAQYVHALELGRLFGGLPVSVNAHWVHGHKGARFVRHFFYLYGRLTPLNIIIAAAEQLEREKEAK